MTIAVYAHESGRSFCVRLIRSLTLMMMLGFAMSAAEPSHAQNNERPTGSMGQPIQIYLDISRVLRTPERTATLVIGNPLIADVSIQTGGIMVVTGKGYGVTNLIAFDSQGNLLMEHPIEVKGPVDQVTVYRGIERESYSCLPRCERRLVLGDNAGYFTGLLGQSGQINAQAMMGAQPR